MGDALGILVVVCFGDFMEEVPLGDALGILVVVVVCFGDYMEEVPRSRYHGGAGGHHGEASWKGCHGGLRRIKGS